MGYGAHRFAGAYVWARRLAEYAVLMHQGVNKDGYASLYEGLQRMKWSGELKVSRADTYAELSAVVGMGLTDVQILDDLEYLRWLGNEAAHVGAVWSEFVAPGSHFLCVVLRVTVSCAEWVRLPRRARI